MISRKIQISLALGMALCGASADATVVASSLPYIGTPDWTDTQFDGTTLGNSGGEATMTTAADRGIWFGWGQGYADPAPSWSPGDPASGNQLTFTARFSDSPRDWYAYLADGAFYAEMSFLPTGCDGNANATACFSAPAFQGVSLLFKDLSNPLEIRRQNIALDMSVDHEFGFLLKGGLVSYLVNGISYAGNAVSSGGHILLIGDSSGSTHTGTGSMTLSAVSFDNAPTGNVVIGAVPEPATWSMMIGGFGLVGAAARRTKRRLAHR